jgi:hypothetical protein
MNKQLKTICIIIAMLSIAACKKESNPPESYLTLKVGDYEEKQDNPALIKTQMSASETGFVLNSKPGTKYPVYILLETKELQAQTYTINAAGSGKFIYEFTTNHVLDAPNNGHVTIVVQKMANNRISGTITGELNETTNTGFKTYPITGSFENMTLQ